jgi:hypothetical protein
VGALSGDLNWNGCNTLCDKVSVISQRNWTFLLQNIGPCQMPITVPSLFDWWKLLWLIQKATPLSELQSKPGSGTMGYHPSCGLHSIFNMYPNYSIIDLLPPSMKRCYAVRRANAFNAPWVLNKPRKGEDYMARFERHDLLPAPQSPSEQLIVEQYTISMPRKWVISKVGFRIFAGFWQIIEIMSSWIHPARTGPPLHCETTYSSCETFYWQGLRWTAGDHGRSRNIIWTVVTYICIWVNPAVLAAQSWQEERRRLFWSKWTWQCSSCCLLPMLM